MLKLRKFILQLSGNSILNLFISFEKVTDLKSKKLASCNYSVPWLLILAVVSGLVCSPVIIIIYEVFSEPSSGWEQLTQTDPGGLLSQLGLAEEIPKHSKLFLRVRSTIIILIGVLLLSSFIGISLAWIVSVWRFPFKKVFSLVLIFPLAIPPYVLATAYKLLTVDWKNQIFVVYREKFGEESSMAMDQVWNYCLTIVVLSFAFYPYIYIATWSSFTTLSRCYIDSARMLGDTGLKAFLKVALPLARPAFIGGALLVSLEVLSEFGTMKILGVNTLTTEIFYTWVNLEDKDTAIRLSSYIMMLVFVLLVLELILRGNKKFHASRSNRLEYPAQKSSGLYSGIRMLVCFVVFFMAFLLPCYEIVRLALLAFSFGELSKLFSVAMTSLKLAIIGSFFILIVSLFLGYSRRIIKHWSVSLLLRVCRLGYALPSVILGVILVTWNGSSKAYFIAEYTFYGSSIGIILAYMIRFLTVGLNSVDSGLEHIPKSLDEASLLLGDHRFQIFKKIHAPLLRSSFCAALLVLFIEILKELPLTFIMSHETLATKSYSLFAVEERYTSGAIPSLALILVSLIGICVIRIFINTKVNYETGSDR